MEYYGEHDDLGSDDDYQELDDQQDEDFKHEVRFNLFDKKKPNLNKHPFLIVRSHPHLL